MSVTTVTKEGAFAALAFFFSTGIGALVDWMTGNWSVSPWLIGLVGLILFGLYELRDARRRRARSQDDLERG